MAKLVHGWQEHLDTHRGKFHWGTFEQNRFNVTRFLAQLKKKKLLMIIVNLASFSKSKYFTFCPRYSLSSTHILIRATLCSSKILANTLSLASYLNCINVFKSMFLAPLLCPLFIKVNVIKTLPQFGNQFDLFQPKHKVIFPTKKKKRQRRINRTRSLKGVALWSSVKRGSSAGFTACALKDTFNYRQRKLGRHAASVITTLQLTHHR